MSEDTKKTAPKNPCKDFNESIKSYNDWLQSLEAWECFEIWKKKVVSTRTIRHALHTSENIIRGPKTIPNCSCTNAILPLVLDEPSIVSFSQ